ncbi:MAG: hypothetical protein WC479_05760 [Candidatus Izemoplasmatales bacterium]
MYQIEAKQRRIVIDCQDEKEVSKFAGVLRGLEISHYIKKVEMTDKGKVETNVGMFIK